MNTLFLMACGACLFNGLGLLIEGLFSKDFSTDYLKLNSQQIPRKVNGRGAEWYRVLILSMLKQILASGFVFSLLAFGNPDAEQKAKNVLLITSVLIISLCISGFFAKYRTAYIDKHRAYIVVKYLNYVAIGTGGLAVLSIAAFFYLQLFI